MELAIFDLNGVFDVFAILDVTELPRDFGVWLGDFDGDVGVERTGNSTAETDFETRVFISLEFKFSPIGIFRVEFEFLLVASRVFSIALELSCLACFITAPSFISFGASKVFN